LEALTPWLLVAGLFIPLRQLQRWLHQHIFKVGWLLTKNYHTTTILYYTIFLPGVFLYEVSLWLAAGILNVRADRAISWPQKQEIGELRLNFVKLHKSAGAVKVGIISLSPLVIGILAVWHIATNILNVGDFLITLRSGGLANLGIALGQLTSVADFWVWVYIIFAISNTMIPNMKDLRGLRAIGMVLIAVAIGLFVMGVGDEVVLRTLTGPVASALNILAGVFAVMIAVNLVMTGVLGLAESLIERITGDSATFVNGKMVTMTRAEMLAQRAKEAEQARKARQAKQRAAPAAVGPPSVYKLAFPIPGPPGKEAVTQSEAVIIETEKPPPLQPGAPRDDRAGPAVITGAVMDKLPAPSTPPRSTPSPTISPSRPATPVVKPPALSSPVTVEKPDEDEMEAMVENTENSNVEEDEEESYDELDEGEDVEDLA
jgi:hypothetical protein